MSHRASQRILNQESTLPGVSSLVRCYIISNFQSEMTSSMDFGLLGRDVLGNLDKSLDVLSSYGSDVQEFQACHLNQNLEEEEKQIFF